jgi:hypothetical protein
MPISTAATSKTSSALTAASLGVGER